MATPTDVSTAGMDGARSTTRGTTPHGTDGTTHGFTAAGMVDGTEAGMAGTTHGTTAIGAATIPTIMW